MFRLQRLHLKFIHFLQRRIRRQCMPLHIKLRRSDNLGQRVTLVELRRLLNLGNQLLRHRCARLIVLCVMIEHRRITWPSSH